MSTLRSAKASRGDVAGTDFGPQHLITKESHMKRTFIFLFVLAFSILTATANAQVTSLTLNSDPGDFIGGGENVFFTPADGPFNAQASGTTFVNASFFGPGNAFWFLDFGAPQGQPLALGTYTGVTNSPITNGPFMDIVGNGRGCDTV